ncbi:TetR/AcrR family transcriptional regulator [Streptomyces sp. NBC_01408]|uniref:TetR/AcrR family transcriptional regulator n=1 Tax=Streptomyces sp. NBC_01408 TaxID=2903855 RepID=UPI0022522B7E|nr:TetR family transcriptional regulator [Streptomyces sp. NBC_01408]MCX4696457.1 TetR family transcriptional regulator [Streptomyces sp. NBC_01408]
MSPRGVAIPDLRGRLFAAAERVVARDGAMALTSRAITAEADCGKGVLHAHFAGLDEFVAELVLDRFARSARQAEALEAKVGQATVAANLQEVALALLEALPPAVVGLAMTRPAAALHTRQGFQAGAPAFDAIQHAFTVYLQGEQRGGRLPADADAATIALALVGTIHHLLMTGVSGRSEEPKATTGRLLAVLLGGAVQSAP